MQGLIIVAQVLVAIAYAGFAWIDRPRPGQESVRERPSPRRWATALVVLAHATIVFRLIFQTQGVNLSFAVSLSLIGLLLAVWLWASGLLMPVPGMASRTLPIVAVSAILPVLLPTPHLLPYATDIVASAHLIVAFLAFALIVIAAVQAAALLALEQELRRGLAGTSATVPPVLTLERWLFGLIAVGFALLTATLASGVVFSESLFGKPIQFTHKTLFAGLAWLLFGVLLAGRWRWGWRGRQALRWVVIGSLLLLIGYTGSKFVLEILLSRT